MSYETIKGQGIRLKKLRIDYKLTQDEMAMLLNKRQQTISKKEEGRRSISVQEYYEINRIFNADLNYLITGKKHFTSKDLPYDKYILMEKNINSTLKKFFKEKEYFKMTYRPLYSGYANRVFFIFEEVLDEINQKRTLVNENAKKFLQRRIKVHQSNMLFLNPVKKQLLNLLEPLSVEECQKLISHRKLVIKCIDKRMMQWDIKTYKYWKLLTTKKSTNELETVIPQVV